jgi:hypothetical protein
MMSARAHIQDLPLLKTKFHKPPVRAGVVSIPNRIVVVRDDYHLITAQPIHQALTFLLDHLPPQLHLSLLTRHHHWGRPRQLGRWVLWPAKRQGHKDARLVLRTFPARLQAMYPSAVAVSL